MGAFLIPLAAEALGHLTSHEVGWVEAGPAVAVFQAAFESWREKRRKIAFETLLEEVRRGNGTLTTAGEEEAAAMMERYTRAADQGAARHNLRFMARLLAGEDPSKPLYAGDFFRHAARIADLSREEVILLSDFYRTWQAHGEEPAPHEVISQSRARLVPTIFETQDAYDATASGLTRTGFFSPIVIALGGDTHYRPSPELHKVASLVRFDTWDDIKAGSIREE